MSGVIVSLNECQVASINHAFESSSCPSLRRLGVSTQPAIIWMSSLRAKSEEVCHHHDVLPIKTRLHSVLIAVRIQAVRENSMN